MWSRKELKTEAKRVLQEDIITILIVVLIMGFANEFMEGGLFGLEKLAPDKDADPFAFRDVVVMPKGVFWDMLDCFYPRPMHIVSISATLAISLGVMLFFIFVGYLLRVGGKRYLVQTACGQGDLSDVVFVFTSGSWLNVAKTMFLRDLFTFLWTLLFIFPGIMKRYSYYMIPYLLAEDPFIDWQEAFQLSKDATNGHKNNIFMLELSFLGWIFLIGLLSPPTIKHFGAMPAALNAMSIFTAWCATQLLLAYRECTVAQLYLWFCE